MPTDAELLELEKRGGLTPTQQEEINQRRDRAQFPPPITVQTGEKQVKDSTGNLPGYRPGQQKKSTVDIASLANNPEFLAASDEAKRKLLAKYSPEFAAASAEAQQAILTKHFHSSKLRDMPAQDPLAKTRVEESEGIAKALGKTALRVGATIVGGRLGGRAGAAAGAGITSYLLGDKPAESLVEAGSAGLFPGTGKTAVRSVAKSGAFATVSSVASSIARGEWPDGATTALNGVIGGVLGYGGFKLDEHLGNLMPGGVAKEAAGAIEHGKLPAGTEVEEANEIRKLRLQLRDKRGQFLPKKGADESLGLARGGTQLVKRTDIDEHIVEEMADLKKNDIFPPYEPTRAPFTNTVNKMTLRTKLINRPMWLADHVQEQTGVPVYDDVYRPLRAALGDEDRTKEEISRIRKTYLGKKSGVPEDVQKVIKDYVTAHGNREYNSFLASVVQSVRKNVPLFGKEISDEDAQRIANNIMSMPSVELLAGRVGPPIRVFSHTFQTGFMKLGGGWIGKGFARGTSLRGIREAVAAGAIGPEELELPEELLSKKGGWYQKAVDIGFLGFRGAQVWSRTVIFQGAKAKAASALTRSGWNNWEKFMDRAGLDIGIPKAEVGLAKYLYEGGREKELLDHIGKVHADSYIPGHSYLDQPFFRRQSDLHMVASQLGNWPSFYATTLKENFFGDGPGKKKAILGARWALANTVMFYAARRAYAWFDDDEKKATNAALELTYANPVFFAGGPALQEFSEQMKGLKQMGKGAAESVLVDAESGQKHAWQGAKRLIKATPFPFKRAGKDIYDLFGGKD